MLLSSSTGGRSFRKEGSRSVRAGKRQGKISKYSNSSAKERLIWMLSAEMWRRIIIWNGSQGARWNHSWNILDGREAKHEQRESDREAWT